jgi:hypothetical protein
LPNSRDPFVKLAAPESVFDAEIAGRRVREVDSYTARGYGAFLFQTETSQFRFLAELREILVGANEIAGETPDTEDARVNA